MAQNHEAYRKALHRWKLLETQYDDAIEKLEPLRRRAAAALEEVRRLRPTIGQIAEEAAHAQR
jgi:hypothetical protein